MTEHSTRTQIVAAADQLFYHQGFELTSFADISRAVQISRGNFYYHFKSKDEILEAVIEHRIARTRDMLETWESESQDPGERILIFFRILLRNHADIRRFGCPVGSLCSELVKLQHSSLPGANQIMSLFYEWLQTQFGALGYEEQSGALAMHVVARSQGVALVASTLGDESFLALEVAMLEQWLATLRDGSFEFPQSVGTAPSAKTKHRRGRKRSASGNGAVAN